ncbi:nucleotidyltransferase family protein [Glutamicibacter sp.]|uniref:nucleotidyltransferase family protein n=1 Tax=Glutamicibacter sp. TaxID=1931995 RepID=UPI0028BF479A|nr:nucleotidyltransferase family protein [Glutamicibacter sp.]
MTNWVATANGALDLTELSENNSGAEIMLLSTIPSEPLGLAGQPASLWRRLVTEGPLHTKSLTDDELQLINEFESAGIASSRTDSPWRQRSIPKPWLSSPFHELIHSLIARVAAANNVRVIFIKGPILHQQGLRTREHSGDVDVWVDPSQIKRFASLLEVWGWELVPGFWGDLPTYHSLTLAPTTWGCEIDLHRHMPGCSLADSDVFNILINETSTVEFAGVDVIAPNRVANAVISALHFTRPHPTPNPQSSEDNAVRVLDLVGVETLAFSDSIRSTAALAPAFQRAFPDTELKIGYLPPLNWRYRAEGNPIKRTFLASRSVKASEWPRFISRLVWPEDTVAMRFDKLHGGRSRTPLQARMNRFRYAVLATFSSKHRV